MDKWQAMTRFVRVCEMQSFTGAADSLGVPKASVSASVSALEDALGIRLLNRTTRKISMTSDGRDYFAFCKDTLAAVDNFESRFQQTPDAVHGVVKVDMPSRFASHVLIPRLDEFYQQYPNIRLDIGSADRRIDMVKEGFDCVIRVGQLQDANYIAKPLGELPVINCASPSYLKRYGEPNSLNSLDQHFLIHYSPHLDGRVEGFEYEEDGQLLYKTMPGKITVNGTEAYLAACVNGLGIAQFPCLSVMQLVSDGRLHAVLPQYQAEAMPLNLNYPSRRNPAKRVEVFMTWLENIVKDTLTQ